MGSITLILVLFLSFLFFIDFSDAANSSSNASCTESEWEALIKFKESIVSNSTSLSSWTGRDCCSWHGITCHNLTGHVQNLKLGGYLNGNFFNSSLSPWLFNLTHLQVLSIVSSGLTGPIPDMFDKLPSLTLLDLSINSFTTLPSSLCSLTNLYYMDFTYSKLQGSLPSCIGNMTSLTTLYLPLNKLSGEIPGGLGNLTHLITLDLSDNHFSSSIPSTFGNLQELESINLANSDLSGEIPSTLGNLTRLISLGVNGNSLTGGLTESFFEKLRSLDILFISSNQNLFLNVSPKWIPPFQLSKIAMDFIGTPFPLWLRTQTTVKGLYMSNTNISGAMPDCFLASFPNLAYLDLSNNFLTGSIQGMCLTDLRYLEYIDLSNNLLTGSVPTFHSASLLYLRLAGNQLIGSIPQQLCNVKSLDTLSLGHNQLTGTIPSCLGSLLTLYKLDLGNNSLSGNVPYELGSLTNLDTLHLNGNKFSGELPGSLQNLTLLKTLDLGNNDFQGSISQWIGRNWPRLKYLRLESNNFSDEVPVILCQMPSLQILNLAINNLVGTIPPCLGNLSSMLSDESIRTGAQNESSLSNTFKGTEMMYTSTLLFAKFISLSGNHLHGQIPSELMNLKGLKSLNLSNNELTGTIPETIKNLKHLESLDLSMNRLSGTIPQSLADIDALGYLNLSFNNLAGKIPSGNHIDTLHDPSIYEGNAGLCGKILTKRCPGDDDSATSDQLNRTDSDADEEFDILWLCAGIGPGFAVGFLTVMLILHIKDSWRIAYFGFVDNVYNKVSVTLTIKISQYWRKFS